ncbi:MAG: tetratricopeptide repeat protein [Gammaproteobacteria bacterium]|nr:tetratricopeptide repeat protein [Gammaproteobacteria bacterium]
MRLLLLRTLVVAFVGGCGDGRRHDDASDRESTVADPIAVGLDSTDANVVAVLREHIEAAQADPASGSRRGTLGLAYEANGYDAAALESYAQAEALDGDAFEWPYLQAILLQQQARFDEALERMDRALEIDPDYAPAWLWRGYWLLDVDRVDEAETSFSRADDLGAGAPAVVGQSRVHLRRDDAPAALELLEPLSGTLDHPLVFRLLGRALRDIGHLDDARLALSKGREARQLTWVDPVLDRRTAFIAGFGGRMLQAESLVASGDAAEALPILEELVIDFPAHATLLNLVAVAYSQTGDAEKSLAVLEKGVGLAPDYYPLHLNLAGAYDDLGDTEKALDHLDRAIEVHPTFSVAHERKGVVLMRMGRYEEALSALDTAARHDARDPEVFYFAGVIESNFERWQPAIERFRQAIEVDPVFTKAYIHMARSYGELRRFDDAREALAKADALGGQAQDARSARAWLDRLEASGL